MSTAVQDTSQNPGAETVAQETAKMEETASVANTENGEDAAVEEPPSKPKPKLCGICEKEDGRYKCPRCSLP